MFVWILCCQGLFILIQESFGEKVVDSIQGQLRQELAVSNFNFLARSITDFTVSGAIECGVLTKKTPIEMKIVDLRYMVKACSINKWELNGAKLDVVLKSLNGDVYEFSFISKNPNLFYFALWGFRLLGLLAILGISFAVKTMTHAETVVAKKMKSLAMQVSHDIRSPLTALTTILRDKKFDNSDEKQLILASLERIQDIANNLLEREKSDGNVKQPTLIIPMINSVVSEKRYEYQGIINLEIVTSYGSNPFISANVDESLFKRVLSNLLNNSIEARDTFSKIEIKVYEDLDFNFISIKDNGKGIPSHLLDKVKMPGYSSKSHEKVSGSGIGLSSAIDTIHSFGGDLSLSSTLGAGTEIVIKLPKFSDPTWLVKKIDLDRYDEVWILDDDPSIHYLWKNLIKDRLRLFSILDHFQEQFHLDSGKRRLYLIDLDLGENISGLDLIMKLGIAQDSILVTSQFNNTDVQSEVVKNKMAMIPKDLLDGVSFISKRSDTYDYVLIDDDRIIRMGWEIEAKKKGVLLLTLSSISEFSNYNHLISKDDTHIFIDNDLGKNNPRGEDFAVVLHKDGFKRISLATGYEASEFEAFPWLSIQGKGVPF